MQKKRTTAKVKDLQPNTGQLPWLPNNPRQWTQTDIDKTAESLKRDPDFLEDRPILATPEGVVFAGNLRLTAARKLRIKEVPVVYYTPENEDDEMTIKRRSILDNGSFGSWDFDALANEWDDLPLSDWGIPAWEPAEDDAIPVEAEEDDFDEEKDDIETRCQPGDIWQLGDHRLMCGDSTDAGNVALLMNGEKADLWLTDPPYNVGYGMQDSAQMAKQNHRTDGLIVMNDKQEDGEFLQFLINAYSAAFANMKPGATFYIWHSGLETFNFIKALKENHQLVRSILIWNKNQLVMGRQDYQWKHEPCLYGWKEGAAHHWYSDRKQTTVIDWDRPKRSEEHPTMKPVGLFGYQMQNSSNRGDAVLDTFGGSGTSLIAAEELGRRCFMMELDPHYCDVILARWEKLTGQTAHKIEQ